MSYATIVIKKRKKPMTEIKINNKRNEQPTFKDVKPGEFFLNSNYTLFIKISISEDGFNAIKLNNKTPYIWINKAPIIIPEMIEINFR